MLAYVIVLFWFLQGIVYLLLYLLCTCLLELLWLMHRSVQYNSPNRLLWTKPSSSIRHSYFTLGHFQQPKIPYWVWARGTNLKKGPAVSIEWLIYQIDYGFLRVRERIVPPLKTFGDERKKVRWNCFRKIEVVNINHEHGCSFLLF